MKIEKCGVKEYSIFYETMIENMNEIINKNTIDGWNDKENKNGYIDLYKNGFVNCVRLNNEIVGFLIYSVKDRSIYINEIQVKKEFKKMGIGRKIMEFVFSECIRLKHNSIQLKVFKDNIAFNFYMKLGFGIVEELNDINSYLLEKKF